MHHWMSTKALLWKLHIFYILSLLFKSHYKLQKELQFPCEVFLDILLLFWGWSWRNKFALDKLWASNVPPFWRYIWLQLTKMNSNWYECGGGIWMRMCETAIAKSKVKHNRYRVVFCFSPLHLSYTFCRFISTRK